MGFATQTDPLGHPPSVNKGDPSFCAVTTSVVRFAGIMVCAIPAFCTYLSSFNRARNALRRGLHTDKTWHLGDFERHKLWFSKRENDRKMRTVKVLTEVWLQSDQAFADLQVPSRMNLTDY